MLTSLMTVVSVCHGVPPTIDHALVRMASSEHEIVVPRFGPIATHRSADLGFCGGHLIWFDQEPRSKVIGGLAACFDGKAEHLYVVRSIFEDPSWSQPHRSQANMLFELASRREPATIFSITKESIDPLKRETTRAVERKFSTTSSKILLAAKADDRKRLTDDFVPIYLAVDDAAGRLVTVTLSGFCRTFRTVDLSLDQEFQLGPSTNAWFSQDPSGGFFYMGTPGGSKTRVFQVSNGTAIECGSAQGRYSTTCAFDDGKRIASLNPRVEELSIYRVEDQRLVFEQLIRLREDERPLVHYPPFSIASPRCDGTLLVTYRNTIKSVDIKRDRVEIDAFDAPIRIVKLFATKSHPAIALHTNGSIVSHKDVKAATRPYDGHLAEIKKVAAYRNRLYSLDVAGTFVARDIEGESRRAVRHGIADFSLDPKSGEILCRFESPPDEPIEIFQLKDNGVRLEFELLKKLEMIGNANLRLHGDVLVAESMEANPNGKRTLICRHIRGGGVFRTDQLHQWFPNDVSQTIVVVSDEEVVGIDCRTFWKMTAGRQLYGPTDGRVLNTHDGFEFYFDEEVLEKDAERGIATYLVRKSLMSNGDSWSLVDINRFPHKQPPSFSTWKPEDLGMTYIRRYAHSSYFKQIPALTADPYRLPAMWFDPGTGRAFIGMHSGEIYFTSPCRK